jgi:hypothetical protein
LTLETLCKEQDEEFRSGRADASKLLAVGDAPSLPGLDPVQCAALTVVAQTMLNHDETVMKR